MSSLVADACATILAVLFLGASFSKVVRFRSFERTLVDLGISAAHLVAQTLLLLELAAALGVALWPREIWGAALVIALAGVFAAVGASALRSGRSIRCNCFAAIQSTPLGRRQIAQFAPLAAAAIAATRATDGLGPVRLATATAAVALVVSLALLPAWLRLRFDRTGKGTWSRQA